MIEKIVADYLNNNLEVPASMEVPERKPRYVVVEKTGGSEQNHIFTATLAIQSYAPRLSEAAALNEEVKKVMRGIEELDEVSSCSLNTDYNFTDTATKKYRYQAIYNLVHY